MNKESTMQDWVDDYEYMVNKGRGYSPYAKTTKKVDKSLKYCSKCQVCWESFYCARGKRWTKYEKNHIPILNKKRELCPACKVKEKK